MTKEARDGDSGSEGSGKVGLDTGMQSDPPKTPLLFRGRASKKSPEGVQLGLENNFLPRRLAGIWTQL